MIEEVVDVVENFVNDLFAEPVVDKPIEQSIDEPLDQPIDEPITDEEPAEEQTQEGQATIETNNDQPIILPDPITLPENPVIQDNGDNGSGSSDSGVEDDNAIEPTL